MGVNNTSIDPNALVEEVFAISNAVENASKDASEAKALYDQQKSYLKFLKAQLSTQFKTGERSIGDIAKPSDKVIENAVESDPTIYEETKKLGELYYDYSISDSYAEGMETKKRALPETIKLALAGWFSDLKITNTEAITNFANGGDATESANDGGRAALRERRRRSSSEED